jgi:osmotically-inducible protein OsmY
MKTDLKIKEDVLEELEWQPNIDKNQIEVTVNDGIVTLKGTVDSYSKKIAAENAAQNVYGVKAVVEDIKIKYHSGKGKTDKDIAKAAVDTLKWNSSVPDESIKIKVEDAWVYLSGVVPWEYQKNAAKKAIQKLHGVEGVINNIVIQPTLNPIEVQSRISRAFERSAKLEAKKIIVEVNGSTVKLTGTVHSVAEKDEARRAAFLAPGVTKVENNLIVDYHPHYAL